MQELTKENVLSFIKEQGGEIPSVFHENTHKGQKGKSFDVINNTFREFAGTYIKNGVSVITAPDGEIMELGQSAGYDGITTLDEMMKYLHQFRNLYDVSFKISSPHLKAGKEVNGEVIREYLFNKLALDIIFTDDNDEWKECVDNTLFRFAETWIDEDGVVHTTDPVEPNGRFTSCIPDSNPLEIYRLQPDELIARILKYKEQRDEAHRVILRSE